MSSVSILPIGSELLDGRVVDTNSRFISEKISLLGGSVNSILTVTDERKAILDALAFSVERSDVLIITGGLGPTSDDLTREVVASFCNVSLKRDEASLEKIKSIFTKRNRVFDPANEKQALYPETGSIISNPIGTAPGFSIMYNDKLIIALPGVPHELYAMWDAAVEKLLSECFKESPRKHSLGFKTFDIAESVVGRKIQELSIPPEIFVSYRAAFPEIEVKLSADTNIDLTSYHQKAQDAVGREHVFTTNLSLSFPQVITQEIKDLKITISTAESCTSGLLAKLLTDEPGASSYFLGGVNAYANEIKTLALNVSKDLLERYGAVSSEVAEHMAKGIRERFNTSLGISITGIAGPEGGTEEKPVGLFYVGVSTHEKTYSKKFNFSGTRSMVRTYAAYVALREVVSVIERA